MTLGSLPKPGTAIYFVANTFAVIAACYLTFACWVMFVVGGFEVPWIWIVLCISVAAAAILIARLILLTSMNTFLALAVLASSIWFPALDAYILVVARHEALLESRPARPMTTMDCLFYAAFLVQIPLCFRRLFTSFRATSR
jgi:hypothetical protein